jgi:hypothetical protein
MTQKIIAQRKVICEEISTGIRKYVTIQIGIPYWPRGEEFASCSVKYLGLFDDFADAKGVDTLQALQQAADVDDMLRRLSHKYRFFWESGDPYFD